MMPLTITGIQEAQAANLRAIRATRQWGALGEAVRVAAVMLHRYAVIETHVDTGALRTSHRVAQRGLARFEIYLDPNAPGIARRRTQGQIIRRRRQVSLTATKPAVYGFFEHERGGDHAFYANTYQQYGQAAATRALRYLENAVK